jgi:hypothetical protein
MQDLKIKLRDSIRLALQEFADIAKEEEDGDYSDAMLSMDRTRAEGYADGLLSAYYQIFGESYEDGEGSVNADL